MTILRLNKTSDIKVKKFEDQRYTVGEQKMLTHELKLIDVTNFKVLEQE